MAAQYTLQSFFKRVFVYSTIIAYLTKYAFSFMGDCNAVTKTINGKTGLEVNAITQIGPTSCGLTNPTGDESVLTYFMVFFFTYNHLP